MPNNVFCHSGIPPRGISGIQEGEAKILYYSNQMPREIKCYCLKFKITKNLYSKC